MTKLTRDQLIEIAQKLLDGEGDDAEVVAWVELISANVPHPAVSDLIYYPSGGREPTAAEVIDEALAYRPPPTL